MRSYFVVSNKTVPKIEGIKEVTNYSVYVAISKLIPKNNKIYFEFHITIELIKPTAIRIP